MHAAQPLHRPSQAEQPAEALHLEFCHVCSNIRVFIECLHGELRTNSAAFSEPHVTFYLELAQRVRRQNNSKGPVNLCVCVSVWGSE